MLDFFHVDFLDILNFLPGLLDFSPTVRAVVRTGWKCEETLIALPDREHTIGTVLLSWLYFCIQRPFSRIVWGRSPRGERGLKCEGRLEESERDESFPSRGTWIEMVIDRGERVCGEVVPLAGNVD